MKRSEGSKVPVFGEELGGLPRNQFAMVKGFPVARLCRGGSTQISFMRTGVLRFSFLDEKFVLSGLLNEKISLSY
jgi:hypothetical protein